MTKMVLYTRRNKSFEKKLPARGNTPTILSVKIQIWKESIPMNMFKKNEGFTLVELIVVIAILAILAAVAVPAYSGYITKAK